VPLPGGPPAKGGGAAPAWEICMLENGPASCRGAEVGFCGANGGGGLDGDEDAMDRWPAERGGDRDLTI